jgi:HmuY protein
MKSLKSILVVAIVFTLFSCAKDDEPTPVVNTPPAANALEVKTFADLHAPVFGVPPNTTGDFVKFNFATNAIVTGDNWDVAFRSTTILVNGGVAGTGQPARTGVGSGSVATGIFSGITTAPADNLFAQDSATTFAVPTGSNNGWYNYNSATNLVSPIAGKVIVVKTHDGKYAKMEILSYYQNGTPNATATNGRYYKFNFVYQPNGTKNF